ncbi:MAG: thioredoxin fold domain-containing protein [Planctomycetes bacterium]|jgi:thiol:disulfide interchange protein DsbD|nr:thioredoxin fold domain-containing protein [Planctomycetota bacterium]
MPRGTLLSLPTLLALLAITAVAASAGEPDPVAARTAAGPADPASGGEVVLTAAFEVAPGAHLYRDRIEFGWEHAEGLRLLRVERPPGARMTDPGGSGSEVEVFVGRAEVRAVFAVEAAGGGKVRLAGTVSFQACTDQVCYPPAKIRFDHDLGAARAAAGAAGGGPLAAAASVPAPGPAEPAPAGSGPPLRLDWKRLLIKVLQAFGIGFLVSLTPCVYPMIGITAAIVGGARGEGERRIGRPLAHSLAYVLGLSIAYAALGVATALAGAPFAQVLKSGWVLLPVSAVFVLLALSMFDVIQIQTPSFLQTRLAGAGRGGRGLPGKFVLGLVSGAVATPCVAAPLIATLVEIATIAGREGLAAGAVFGFAMLFSLAWGMGIVLIAAGVLTAGVLPRSGAWMVWIKQLFGFGMLWAAVYFARPVAGEAVYDLLTSLVLFAGVAFLGGMDRLTAESGAFDRIKRAAAVPVLVMAVLLFAGAVQGLTDRFPWLDCGKQAPAEAEPGPFRAGGEAEVDAAAASGNPVVIDFWATWCSVCKKLDRTTFADARVRSALKAVNAIKADYDREPDLVKRFGAVGVPTVVFLDGAGRERKDLRFSGELSPEEFLAKLDALGADRR